MKNKKYALIVLLLLSVILFNACTKDTSNFDDRLAGRKQDSLILVDFYNGLPEHIRTKYFEWDLKLPINQWGFDFYSVDPKRYEQSATPIEWHPEYYDEGLTYQPHIPLMYERVIGISFYNCRYKLTIGNIDSAKSTTNEDILEWKHIEKLFKITHFKCLDLTGCNITFIPESIKQCSNLRTLDLNYNSLTTVPEVLAYLPTLRSLSLSNNKITGKIPNFLGQLKELYFLSLDDNSLTGDIPISLSNLTQLSNLGLRGNNFSGCIPQNLIKAVINDRKFSFYPITDNLIFNSDSTSACWK